ncbi:hypothetical protein TrLO_g2237 [Triparma laevis f. longispina]|uniref:Tyrosine specific protein phosphatases domain-containing protein n=1 Tax=Triparma laevis f. longispina TaxID=1714387 RepID=A0A9W7CI59_9STRA|nr:hypothetical protein TrLO_g2237 [Triparma laevis f. longispina]
MNPEPTPQAPPNPALPLSPHSSILSTDRTDRWCAQQIADTGIWLGSVKAAPYSPSSGKPNEAKAEVLREKGIGFIINCGVVPTKSSATEMTPPPGFHYLYLTGLAENATNLSTYLTACLNFYHQSCQSNSAILVHCAQGIHRSPSVVAALLIALTNGEMDVGDARSGALEEIQKARSRATSNSNFVRQLQVWRYNMWPPQMKHKRTRFN